jgi:C4-dicarboxylate-specific signal transduction histidine kinase
MELEVGHGETEVYARARRLVTIIDRSSEFIGFAAMDGTAQYVNPAGRTICLASPATRPISHLRIFDFLAEQVARLIGRPVLSRDLRDQKRLESDLRQMNESLEGRVAERAAELRMEIAERERADLRTGRGGDCQGIGSVLAVLAAARGVSTTCATISSTACSSGSVSTGLNRHYVAQGYAECGVAPYGAQLGSR